MARGHAMSSCAVLVALALAASSFILVSPVNAVPGQASFKSKCSSQCTEYGTCNEELGRCDCPRHRMGDSCEIELDVEAVCHSHFIRIEDCRREKQELCVNGCNERGKCIGGFCHCFPGHWGTDCALSYNSEGEVTVLAGTGYKPLDSNPLIYIYELPPKFNVWWHPHQLDRPHYYLLWQRILSSGRRTADPAAADFFFVPVSGRQLSGRDQETYSTLVDYLSSTWPMWKETQGWRHLFFASGDHGRKEMAPQVQAQAENSTWLQLWGLYQEHPAFGLPAHRPDRDIVVPVLGGISLPRPLVSPFNPKAPQLPKTNTFFFAGGICGWMDHSGGCTEEDNFNETKFIYSAGVRQKVWRFFRHLDGYKVLPSTPTYDEDLASSTFCLAPAGAGWGKRNVLATIMGCVPVVVSDGVYQPLEPQLDWGKFGVRIAEADLLRLPQILEGLSQQELEPKQKFLRCASLHLRWSSILGGTIGEDSRYDAFATLMEILRVKRERPDLAPQDYEKEDERFRKFINCELGELELSDELLCTLQRQPLHLAPTRLCDHHDFWYGEPGGQICNGCKSLADCPGGPLRQGDYTACAHDDSQLAKRRVLRQGAAVRGGSSSSRAATSWRRSSDPWDWD